MPRNRRVSSRRRCELSRRQSATVSKCVAGVWVEVDRRRYDRQEVNIYMLGGGGMGIFTFSTILLFRPIKIPADCRRRNSHLLPTRRNPTVLSRCESGVVKWDFTTTSRRKQPTTQVVTVAAIILAVNTPAAVPCPAGVYRPNAESTHRTIL